MPKRKREAEADDRPRLSAKQQRLDHKIAQGSIHLGHAFKVAKSFERQKLGRREKTARAAKSDKDVVRIEAEIAALKTLDTSSSAHLLLHRTLSKIKAVTTHELFVVYLSTPPAALQDVASQNIYARLCNSKPVKEALASLLEGVLAAAHIQAHKSGTMKRKADAEQEKEQTRVEPENQDAEDDAEDQRQGDELDSDDESGSGDEYAKYEDRLADSDQDSDGDIDDGEFDDISKLEAQLRGEGVADREDWSGSEDDVAVDDVEGENDVDDNESNSGPRPARDLSTKAKARASKSATSAAGRPTSSVLLPSLTMSGYISASDGSEAEDLDEKPRKNRPGQRARQAIWEKKYGSGAKHLQDTASAKSRDRGWDMKRGATSGSTRGGGRFSRGFGGRDDPVDGIPAVKKKPRKDDTGKLHPSWEAAKLAKEKKAAGAATFVGKKISFD